MYYCPYCNNPFSDEIIDKLDKCPVYTCNMTKYNIFKLDERASLFLNLIRLISKREKELENLEKHMEHFITDTYCNYISVCFWGLHDFDNIMDCLLSNDIEICHSGSEENDEYTTEIYTSLDNLKERVNNTIRQMIA